MKYCRKSNRIAIFLLTISLMIISSVPVQGKAGLMPGYENPERIIIASPAEGFTTTSSKVSILGACDYNYPLYMNGEPVETTTYGFFTKYVSLEIGTNEFIFTNGDDTKTFTITRKKAGSGGSSEPVPYIEYTDDVYGKTTAAYTMTRSSIGASDVSLMPLPTGTTFKILGEQGSFYKIFDGSFVAKSNVEKYSKKLSDNKVSSAVLTDDTDKNVLVTKFKMNVNALYRVEFTDSSVILTLYETISSPKVTVKENDTISRIKTTIYKSLNRTVEYNFQLKEGRSVSGYDVEYKDGAMYFYLKKQPHLEKQGSLKGATVLLDSGHGGTETGAVGPMGLFGPVEKDINLNITLLTKKYLENMGAKVVLTHAKDTTLSLKERVAAIRSLKPDLSLSIHANSMPQTADYNQSRSFLTYYSYALGNDAVKSLNDSIISDMAFKKRNIVRESLSLTRITTNPAVLIETAFLSYPPDYEFLLFEENQEAIAKATANAIRDYLMKNAVYSKQEESAIGKESGKSDEITYIVKKGDYLSKIAKTYQVTLTELKEWNSLRDINYIEVGQKLIVKK